MEMVKCSILINSCKWWNVFILSAAKKALSNIIIFNNWCGQAHILQLVQSHAHISIASLCQLFQSNLYIQIQSFKQVKYTSLSRQDRVLWQKENRNRDKMKGRRQRKDRVFFKVDTSFTWSPSALAICNNLFATCQRHIWWKKIVAHFYI